MEKVEIIQLEGVVCKNAKSSEENDQSTNFHNTRDHVTSLCDKYYSTVGLLTSYFKDKDDKIYCSYGTGTLISPNYVLTCAHNVNLGKNTYLQEVYFEPGKTCYEDRNPLKIKIIDVHTPEKYSFGDIDYDLAVLELEHSVGNRTGFVSFQALDDKELKNIEVTITGYPGEFKKKKHLEQLVKTKFPDFDFNKDFIPFMMRQSGYISSVENNNFHYKIHTSKGQSGSGIVYKTNEGKHIIVGIHTAGATYSNMSCRLTGEKIEWINKILKNEPEDENKDVENEILMKIRQQEPNMALAVGMDFLNHREFYNIDEFTNIAKVIMDELLKLFSSSYKVVNKYLMIALKMHIIFEENIVHVSADNSIQEDSNILIFKEMNTELAKSFKHDWKVTRKILSIKQLFTPQNDIFENSFKDKWLLEEFAKSLMSAKQSLLWMDKAKKKTVIFGCYFLNEIEKRIKENEVLMIECIKEGRLDKKKLNLPHTLMIGDDGGLYVLLNSVKKNEEINGHEISEYESLDFIESILEENDVKKDYMRDKLIEEKSKYKIVIGKGSFGKIRLAINLFDTDDISSGDLICVKKYKKAGSNNHMKAVMIEFIIREYFSHHNPASKVIYSPAAFDIANKNLEKCYLFMQLIPRNTGSNIFRVKKVYEDLKVPYLLDIVKKTLELLQRNIVFTDLKPENTLFDPENCSATLIDLGGAIQIQNPENFTLNSLNSQSHFVQYTKEFSAPEFVSHLDNSIGTEINMRKCLAFSFGKLVENIFLGHSSNQDGISSRIFELIKKLTCIDAEERLSLEEAELILKNLNETSSEEQFIIKDFIFKSRAKIKNHPEILALNPNIHDIRINFLPLEIAFADPSLYSHLEILFLEKKFEEFISDGDKKVMLLFGNAGSGKTTFLQLKYIEAIEKWKLNENIPIYLNLAQESKLEPSIQNIDTQLNSNLKSLLMTSRTMKNGVNLYIDSLDEADFTNQEGENLIKNYLNEIIGVKINKIFITCRSGYHQNINEKWLLDVSDQSFNQKSMTKLFIVPINYDRKKDVCEIFCRSYCKTKEDEEICYEKIKRFGLTEYLTTGLMFKIISKIIPFLDEKKAIQWIPLSEIYSMYLNVDLEENKKHLSKDQIDELQKKYLNGDQNKLIRICMNLVWNLHSESKSMKKYNTKELAKLFEDDEISNNELFKILNLLPIKFQIEKNSSDYWSHSTFKSASKVSVGFVHDTIKNFFILQVLLQESSGQFSMNTKILGTKMITTDFDLMNFISNTIHASRTDGKKIQDYLLHNISESRNKHLETSNFSSANSISLLVASKYNFSGYNLSKINIKGADLTGGNFSHCDFSEANLENVKLSNVKFSGAKFLQANLKNVEFSMLPDLIGHTESVNNFSYSPCGKKLATCSSDFSCKIWDLFNGNEVKTLKGHKGNVNCISYSPDGNYIASCSDDKSCIIWDANTGFLLKTLEIHKAKVNHIAFSPDSKYLASGSGDFSCIIWEISTNNFNILKDHSDDVSYVAYSKDGKNLATCSRDGTCKLWKSDSKEEVVTLKGHKDAISLITFSPSNKQLASCSNDSTCITWDISSRQIIWTLKGHKERVTYASYSPDEKSLATSSWDYTCRIWDLSSGQVVHIMQGHTSRVNRIIFSYDGKFLVSASSDRTCKFWDALTGTIFRTLNGHTDTVSHISFSPNGKYLASCSKDKTCKIWEASMVRTLNILHGHDDRVNNIEYSNDGEIFVSSSWDNTCRIWDSSTGKLLKVIRGHTKNVSYVTFSPDSKRIATSSYDKTCKVWNRMNGKLIFDLNVHTDEVYKITYCKDGKYLASCSKDKSCIIWNSTSGLVHKILKEHKNSVLDLNFSPDAKYLASCSSDYSCIIWDVSSGNLVKTLTSHKSLVSHVNFSHDGNYLISCSNDSLCIIWNISEGNMGSIKHELNNHTQTVNFATFSPDGEYVASCSSDQTCKIWDTTSGKLVQTLYGHSSDVKKISFSSDGKFLVSCSDFPDNTCKIWDVTNGKLVKTLEGHTRRVTDVTFSPDGKYIASCSWDKSCKIWNALPGSASEKMQGHSASVNCAIYSPCGKYIATSSDDGSCKIWDASNGGLISTVFKFCKNESKISFSNDGRQLVSCSKEKKCKIWDIEHQQIIQEIKDSENELYRAEFSPDGKYLAICSDSYCKIWGLNENKFINKLDAKFFRFGIIAFSPDGKNLIYSSSEKSWEIWSIFEGKLIFNEKNCKEDVICVAYSPKGKYIAICFDNPENSIKVLNSVTKENVTIFKGHSNRITSVSFSPDERRLASSSVDKTSKIWCLESGIELKTLHGHLERINHVSFSPDGKYLVTCSTDMVIKIWDSELYLCYYNLHGKPNDLNFEKLSYMAHSWLKKPENDEHVLLSLQNLRMNNKTLSDDKSLLQTLLIDIASELQETKMINAIVCTPLIEDLNIEILKAKGAIILPTSLVQLEIVQK